ncbi:MAG: hypothetical protein R3E98_02890 [Gemmatimonadota bacterium]|nr:hypothetical protein [Gemmatimonadota bacterium]
MTPLRLCHRHRFAVGFAVLAGVAACSDGGPDPVEPTPDPPGTPAPADTLWHGVGLSPAGFPADFNGIETFFAEMGGLATGAVMQNGPWRDDLVGGTDAGQIPAGHDAVLKRAAAHGYRPVLVFGWRSEGGNFLSLPGHPANDWTNTDAAQAFQAMVVDVARTWTPPFLFLGNESDFYYAEDPVDYARWVAAYEQMYDAIKAVSPGTRVGPVFNFEHLAGAGGLNGWSTSNWGALDAHGGDHMDVVGLTLYPFFGHARASELPGDYLSPLLSRLNGIPLAITETGWPAEDLVGGAPWETGEDQQVAFLGRLDSLLSGVQVDLINWLFLHPMTLDANAPIAHKVFGSISLRTATGAKRPVYDLFTGWTPGG